ATYRELEKIYRKRGEPRPAQPGDGRSPLNDSQPHLARVLVAQAAMVERTGDLDAAEKGYREALVLVPGDFTVLSALIDLHVNVRRYDAAAETIVQFLDSKGPGGGRAPREVRVPALLRLAEIHADCEMDPQKAARVLADVLRFDPTNQEALY